MNINQFVNNPPVDIVPIIQSLYYNKYQQDLNPHFLKYSLTTHSVIVIHNIVQIIISLQVDYTHSMFVFEDIITQLQIKLFQLTLVLKEISNNNFVIDAELDHLKCFKNFTGDYLGINCDVICDEKLLLYRDVVEECMNQLCRLMTKVIENKKDIHKLYKLSLGRQGLLCGVCKEFCIDSFKTECGHDFCYECYVKCHSLKNACPVCRNVKSFKYIMGNEVNLLQKIKTLYVNSKLSWLK